VSGPGFPGEAGLELPPLEPLHALLARLDLAGLPHALGASGLLAANGLVRRVNDWDVTVDADLESLAAACDGLEFTSHGHSGCHADHKLGFEKERIELIARFAFFVPGGVVRIPTSVTGRWRDVPLGSPTAWAAAYALMGELEDSPRRRERADLWFGWLRGRPPEREVIDALRAQPLPAEIDQRLVSLLAVTGR
jgi:hypothetical protein